MVVVVGSLNADIIVPVDRLPVKGETVVARDDDDAGKVFCGGKGANQAVAAQRLGAKSMLVCQFGDDAHAAFLEEELVRSGVDVSRCGRCDKPSGQGLVMLQKDGSVSSIVIRGSNEGWYTEGVNYSNIVKGASCVMLQREIPEGVNEAVADAAAKAGIPVFQDVGGEERPISDQHLKKCTYLCPNETELKRLTGMETSTDEEVLKAARALIARGAQNVLVTLGGDGSVLVSSGGTVIRQKTCPLPGGAGAKVVDETGAGDAFRAAFAVSIAEGKDEAEALEIASAAGAIAVSRMGAVPSLPHREETLKLKTDALSPGLRGGGPSLDEGFPLEFGSRLNSMKDRSDLWSGGKDVWGWVDRQGTIKGLDLVDFNYPQHLEGKSFDDARGALAKNGLKAGAICMRFPKEMQAGAYTHPDPAMRQRAIDLTIEGGNWAKELGAKELVIWSAFCGYDYHFQCDYSVLWDRVVQAFQKVCDTHPDLKVSLEFKPTDENTRFFTVPTTGAAMLLCNEVNRANFGLTLDFGHMITCGENPAQSVAMVGRAGKLFGVQLNDGYGRGEDGLMFASVHTNMALEMVYWLQRTKFAGHVYFDTFPRNEDPVLEAEYNIRKFKELWARAGRMRDAGVEGTMQKQDALASLNILDKSASG